MSSCQSCEGKCFKYKFGGKYNPLIFVTGNLQCQCELRSDVGLIALMPAFEFPTSVPVCLILVECVL